MTNKEINDRQRLPKNFNLFVLTRKEIQGNEIKRQSGDLEKERISRERDSEIYLCKNNRMNEQNYR